ncbi:hypothetical protein B0I37DRAFT_166178 [Chaetomium sp. MPI-CAGE-AT-0009]|nr:hypothetical protein B0I37DRAFT_166178 [Chaetomium sp. MPI-CAGE-AT-0009]
MNSYQAGREAGVLYVKDSIIMNMVYVRGQPEEVAGSSYDLYKFQMVVSVAHEIVHFLTGFLTGTMRPHTPPGVTAEPYGNKPKSGEAGRYWENDFLGGFLEMWSLPDDPLGARQPGVPMLFLSGKADQMTGLEVSMSYIDDFLNQRFSFPIRTSTRARPITKNQLKRSGRLETSVLRAGPAFRAAGRVDSPGPGQLGEGSDPRFRRIVNDPVYGSRGSGSGSSGYSGSAYGGSGNGGRVYSRSPYR